jgi:hypothetical protein
MELDDTPVRSSRPSKKEQEANNEINPDDNYPPGVIISKAVPAAAPQKKGKRKLVRKPKGQRTNDVNNDLDTQQRREDQDVNPTRNAILWASQWVPIFRNFDSEWEISDREPKVQDLTDRNDAMGVEKHQQRQHQLVWQIPSREKAMLGGQSFYYSLR